MAFKQYDDDVVSSQRLNEPEEDGEEEDDDNNDNNDEMQDGDEEDVRNEKEVGTECLKLEDKDKVEMDDEDVVDGVGVKSKSYPASPLPDVKTSVGSEEQLSQQEHVYLATLQAKEVYILMSKEYRISRNRRAEWFFSHVNTCLPYPPDIDDHEGGSGNFSMEYGKSTGSCNGSSDFEVVSIIPLNPPSVWSFANRHAYKYHVNPNTVVTYLSRRYRIVFCLDISPSIASVDVQAGDVIFDKIFRALQTSLRGLLQPFEIPGSKRMFRPEIFVTVIAHSPFFTPVTDQVLIQGQILDSSTCDQLIKYIFDRLNDIENRIAGIVSTNVYPNLDTPNYDFNDVSPIENTKLDKAFQNTSVYTSLSMSPDLGLLDLLRQALIALSLMPENSAAGLVILTDGVISVPDGRYLDIILSQLRYNTVSCSFIQLSSPFHPHLCHGVLPYADLMKFIASATFGAFLSDAPDINDPACTMMNVYHMAFLAWSFQKTLETEWTKSGPPTTVKPGEWSVRNKCFFSVRDMPIVKKQQYENMLHVDHMKVMSCRLREGFTIKEVVTSPETGLSEVTLILPWKFLIHLEYKILINSMDDYDSLDKLDNSGYPSKVRCVVSLEGPYDFLHDVTCLAKKPFSSLYRQLMVNRFWATRKNLSESDRLLVHLNSFSSNPLYFNIPESLRNGVPLFYWGSTTNATPQLQSNEFSIPQFTHFWKPVCLLDTTVWQKWMHTHRIGVILEHDYPLPKSLHLPTSTGRFNVIQCRQAVMALNTLLKNMSSFVLLENQSYVQLMFKDDEKVPYSFCLIRLTSKPPHVVLRLAFLVGTPGHLRHRTVATFREKIATLMFPQRVKDPPKWRVITNSPSASSAASTASPLVNKTSWSEMPCCVIVQKPVEKILIRYDKSPEDFRRRLLPQDAFPVHSFVEGKSSVPKQSTFGFRPTFQTPWSGSSNQMLPEVFNTIARYLHHKRWIWWFPGGDLSPLNIKWASEILTTVTKMRLQEGFRFAYSSGGITNMVLELPMKNKASKKNTVTPMVLQFVVFPPTCNLKSEFEDFDSFDAHNNLYLVTECWVEPQCGHVVDTETNPLLATNFLDLECTAISKHMFETDQKCISLVGTFEYLVRICGHKEMPFLISANQSLADKPIVNEIESIDVIPFQFDLKQILRRSGQVEILFSSFFQDLSLTFPNEWNNSVSTFFERANNVLYQQWCCNIAAFQDKEVLLSGDQHDAATKSILKRRGVITQVSSPASTGARRLHEKSVEWRCFVRSRSNTHVLLTLVPASLKDVKILLLQMDNMDSLHKTKCSRYVDFLDTMELSDGNSSNVVCPNQLTHPPVISSSPPPPLPSAAIATSIASAVASDPNHSLNCQTCQSSRKRVRAFSGGECAPAVKKYLADDYQTPSGSYDDCIVAVASSDVGADCNVGIGAGGGPGGLEQIGTTVRSQTFSEGTISGKLALARLRAKRVLNEQTGEQEDNICSDPQRCSQLNDYLSRAAGVIGGLGSNGIDDSLRCYVPCRAPIVGSLALSLFTFSCSLLSLTDHVVFNKFSNDEMVKDFRMFKTQSSLPEGLLDYEFDGDDDDEDLRSSSSTLLTNGRSVSQESFSESSLQRLEMAEHELMLKSHCIQLKESHLQAFVTSTYKSLLCGYFVNPNDINMVVEKCALTNIYFPLDSFLKHVCRHEKNNMDCNDDENESDENKTESNCCMGLQYVHQFIRKRFRRLLARNFSLATENGHILYYKVAHSLALSDISGTGMVKCSSDLDDLDSFSIVADSLCSIEDPLLPSVIVSESDIDKNAAVGGGTPSAGTHADSAGLNDEQGICSGFTTGSSLSPAGSPLFCYLSCRFQPEEPSNTGKITSDTIKYIPITDIPTCYHDLYLDYMNGTDKVSLHSNDGLFASNDASFSKMKFTLKLTFLTSPDNHRERYSCNKEYSKVSGDDLVFDEDESCENDEYNDKSEKAWIHPDEFKSRLQLRQTKAIEHIVNEIEWLIEDEITSFRGNENEISLKSLEKIAAHVCDSGGKPGCQHQRIFLTFVEHTDEKGFHSLVERINNHCLSVNEYSFRQQGLWWYLVHTPSSMDGKHDDTTPHVLPPFWIILKASVDELHVFYHCRFDENDLGNITFSRSLRVRITDLIALLIRTVNQDLLLQQLHDSRMCSPLLELEDVRDPQSFESLAAEDVSSVHDSLDLQTKFGSESDISSATNLLHLSTTPNSNFAPGMFSCQVVWVTTFTLHSRLRSGGGKSAFARGIQTLRSTLIAFEVANRKNMFVYRDAAGRVFYMRFYRAVDVLDSPSKDSLGVGSGGSGGEDNTERQTEPSFTVPVRGRRKHNDSESDKTSRDDTCDGVLALKVHGIEAAGEEIKDKLVQSLRNKLDDAVLDILSVTLKRNPHCKLTPEDVHFLQEPRSRPDCVFQFALSSFIVSGHLPAFAYFLQQNLLQFLTTPKYTSIKAKHHFQDYSRLEGYDDEGCGEPSSIYLYIQSPGVGGAGTGNRGIAVLSMALTDKIGNPIKNPDWRQPQINSECLANQFDGMIETRQVTSNEDMSDVMVEFSMWKQGRINVDLLKNHVDQAIKQAGWDLVIEYKLLTAPLSVCTPQEEQLYSAFMDNTSSSLTVEPGSGTTSSHHNQQRDIRSSGIGGVPQEMRRRSSHLNPGTSHKLAQTIPDEDDEPRTRSMSFTGLRKSGRGEGDADQNRDRAPSPICNLISGRGVSEGSRPRILVSRPPLHQMSLTKLESGEVGRLHCNYTSLLDSWLENGTTLGAPSLRRIVVPLNCRYSVKGIVRELEKIVATIAPDNTARQFWKLTDTGGDGDIDYVSIGGGLGERHYSGDDTDSEYYTLKRHEKELLTLENTEEAEYPSKILNLFKRNENFQPNYTGHACYFISRNLAHWKSCLTCDAEFSLHSPQDFKNLYKYPPLLNENVDMDGSRSSIEKLPRVNVARDFVLWSGKRDECKSLILIPRQRFLRAKVTTTEVDFVVYNWSKECCERLSEQVTQLSDWIQARAALLQSLLAQKSGMFYYQPVVGDNFASSVDKNPFIAGDVDLKDLILNTPPGKQTAFERRNTGSRKQLNNQSKSSMTWTDFYRNIPLYKLLGMPDAVGDNPVDTHGRQLLHVLNVPIKEPDNTFFQYWLTRGPSASNVITTQVLESFKQAARTIHFCLTPVMFLPSWRSAVAQTRDSDTMGGIIKRNRGSSRRFQGPVGRLSAGPSVVAAFGAVQPRMRHGSEASQGSSLSLRNRSRSYHSGMVNLFLPEEKEMDTPGASSPQFPSNISLAQMQSNTFLKVKSSEEPWHGVLCRLFLQEYMQYLQTLGFVPVHCKGETSANESKNGRLPGAPKSPVLNRGTPGGSRRVGIDLSVPATTSVSEPILGSNRTPGPSAGVGTTLQLGGITEGGIGQTEDQDGDGDMCHFLQRCLPGGIIVIEVGLVPPFFYCKLHALEAKRIFPKGPKNKVTTAQNAVQFVDECEKMKILTHLHSFMYDFHLRAMYLYISGRQLLFKIGYHIASFLDDFITYYPKCPNFSRNTVHVGMVTLKEVNTPSQVLFNYILGHDKYYRMKVIRMTPLNSDGSPVNITTPIDFTSDSVNEYVLVHNMSRKVSYRDREDETQSDEFDLTLVIAHDYPTASRDFVPDYQGLRVKYYIVLTSRRKVYPKGDNEPNSGKLRQVNTPEPLCTRHLHCSSVQATCVAPNNRLGPPTTPSYYPQPKGNIFEFREQSFQNILEAGATGGAHGYTHYGDSYGDYPNKLNPFPELIREEKVRYMGYFSSHEQMMQKIIDEQKDTMEQFIRTIVTKAAIDCRRDLLWQRLLMGRQEPAKGMVGNMSMAKASISRQSRVNIREPVVKEDIISRETVGPLYYNDFNELLDLVQKVPLRQLDPRLEDLLKQPITFYQTLIKVLMSSGHTGSPYNYREFISVDNLVHQLAIFTADAHKSIVMVEVNMEKAVCDMYVVFKDGNKKATILDPQLFVASTELGEAMFSLVEKVIHACCYTTWTSLI